MAPAFAGRGSTWCKAEGSEAELFLRGLDFLGLGFRAFAAPQMFLPGFV